MVSYSFSSFSDLATGFSISLNHRDVPSCNESGTGISIHCDFCSPLLGTRHSRHRWFGYLSDKLAGRAELSAAYYSEHFAKRPVEMDRNHPSLPMQVPEP